MKKAKKKRKKLAKKLENTKVPLIRQASEGGQLYGSVTSRDIAGEVSAVSKEKVERSMVLLNQNFKSIGLFPVEILLHPEVKVEITVNIARSPEEADIQAETGKALVSDAAPEEAEQEEQVEVDEAALEEVLEESALEAEKEKQAEEAEKAAEEAAKEEERKAKAEAKAAEKAAEEEAAAAEEAETAEGADVQPEEAGADAEAEEADKE